MNNSHLFFFSPIFIWGFVANITYLKDFLFLSFFSYILTYIGFICLKPYPILPFSVLFVSFVHIVCLLKCKLLGTAVLNKFLNSRWTHYCWEQEPMEKKVSKTFCSSLLEFFPSHILGAPLPRTISKFSRMKNKWWVAQQHNKTACHWWWKNVQ